jgi:hypothetical protein
MKSFHDQMQRYVARLSVGASTVRGQRAPGLVTRCREELAAVDLRRFAVGNEATFKRRLNAETLRIQARLPQRCRHWGLARKVLNIFLRFALYNVHLRERFGLHKAEAFLEIPLDKFTAKGLQRRSPARSLPRWPGVKHLTAGASERFQTRASEIAAKDGIDRVHLDIVLWLERD